MKILVTGSKGQLGKCIKNESKNYPLWNFTYTDFEELDICNETEVNDFVQKNNFDFIINCAAYTAVDKAESDKQKANLVNNVGVKNLAKASREAGGKLVHISTDYVFDGNNTEAYKTDEKLDPINIYGYTKALGEKAIFDESANAIIIRTSWVYSEYGKNFLKTMEWLGREKPEISVINDQTGSPTYAKDLASAILFVMDKPENWKPLEIYHYQNTGKITWHDFAKEIMQISNSKTLVNPILTSQYPTPAKRPSFSLLDTKKIVKDFGLAIPSWKLSLQKAYNNYIKNNKMNFTIEDVITIAKDAGKAILEIYETDFEVENKDDKSPLTAADKAANDIIIKGLKNISPEIPIISEETKDADYSERKDWDMCWIVDPLDGTKEFIKKNGEFTVNIALIKNGKPVSGVVYVPVADETYYADLQSKAFYQKGKSEAKSISVVKPEKAEVTIMGSRSHMNEDTEKFVEEQKQNFDNVNFIAAGSSLKLCRVAEGKAHLYPRFAPTMEWDTAAGQSVVEAAGGSVIRFPEKTALLYNKENLLNPHFLVSYE